MIQKNHKNQNEEPEEVIEAAIEKTEFFLFKNGKVLIISLCVVFVAVSAFFGIKYLYSAPREQKASTMAFVAEQQFARDSFAMALNGYNEAGTHNAGFLEVIEEYASTNVGNIANHYAGICYLKMGDYENAIKYLSAYKKVEGTAAILINSQNSGLIGDAYVQINKLEEAVKMYENTISSNVNDMTTPFYLKKLGLIYEKQNDTAKALAAYNRIKNEFYRSFEARDIDKYIGRLSQK